MCEHYMKTGRCDYHMQCVFDHPVRDESLLQALDRRECFDHIRKGYCNYGERCKYRHPPRAPQSSTPSQAPPGPSTDIPPPLQSPHHPAVSHTAHAVTQATASQSQSQRENTPSPHLNQTTIRASNRTNFESTSMIQFDSLPSFHSSINHCPSSSLCLYPQSIHRSLLPSFHSSIDHCPSSSLRLYPQSIHRSSLPSSHSSIDHCSSSSLRLHPQCIHPPKPHTKNAIQGTGKSGLLNNAFSLIVPRSSTGNVSEHFFAGNNQSHHQATRRLLDSFKSCPTDIGIQTNHILQARLSSFTLDLCDYKTASDREETALDMLREPGSDKDVYVGRGLGNLFGHVGDGRRFGGQPSHSGSQQPEDN